MLASQGLHSVIGVEPNSEMLNEARKSDPDGLIRWVAGSAEATGLDTESADIVTMASSFHWADFDSAMKEFSRVLRPGGRFVALWNPRIVDSDPLFVSIEQALSDIGPDLRRVSSGKSGMTVTLTERLRSHPGFEDICYFEGHHTVRMTREQYLGAWRSVNDVQVQLGETRFLEFLRRIEELLGPSDEIVASYLTRAWLARKKT
jgi:SAM-dependent methyltransferase